MTPFERLKKLVQHVLTPVDFYAARAGKVVAQNADGTLELQLDDPRFPDLGKVPFWQNGGKLKIAAGSRCLVTFTDGDPSRPVAAAFDAASVLEMVLGDQDGAAVARQGDAVVLTMPAVVPLTGSMTVGGTPTPFTAMATITTPLTGMILTGSGRVKAAS